MSVCTIGINRKIDRNAIARLSAAQRRLFNRLKSWNPTLAADRGLEYQSANPREFLKYMLNDEVEDPIDVAHAMVALRDSGMITFEAADPDAFKHEATEAAREILMQRGMEDIHNAN